MGVFYYTPRRLCCYLLSVSPLFGDIVPSMERDHPIASSQAESHEIVKVVAVLHEEDSAANDKANEGLLTCPRCNGPLRGNLYAIDGLSGVCLYCACGFTEW